MSVIEFLNINFAVSCYERDVKDKALALLKKRHAIIGAHKVFRT